MDTQPFRYEPASKGAGRKNPTGNHKLVGDQFEDMRISGSRMLPMLAMLAIIGLSFGSDNDVSPNEPIV